jgi:RimJ/RimL family protein N-acetyltransferase
MGMELLEDDQALGPTAMEPTFNDLGQPIGFPLPGWAPPPAPPREPLEGRFCRLEPLDPDRHAADLFAADAADADGRSWTYLAYGPFRTLSDYRTWMGATCLGADPLFFAIIASPDGKAVGVASHLRITPASGSIEVGHIHYSPRLQRSPAATEAMYLLMERAFGLGYRRYEWKCDALNAASRAAAQRLGLSFEGVFRQTTVYKGRNRDTAWYAAVRRRQGCGDAPCDPARRARAPRIRPGLDMAHRPSHRRRREPGDDRLPQISRLRAAASAATRKPADHPVQGRVRRAGRDQGHPLPAFRRRPARGVDPELRREIDQDGFPA